MLEGNISEKGMDENVLVGWRVWKRNPHKEDNMHKYLAMRGEMVYLGEL